MYQELSFLSPRCTRRLILTRREQSTGNREQGGTKCFLFPVKKRWVPRPLPYAVRKKVVGVGWGFDLSAQPNGSKPLPYAFTVKSSPFPVPFTQNLEIFVTIYITIPIDNHFYNTVFWLLILCFKDIRGFGQKLSFLCDA